jgi:hypothetical protein
MKTAAAFAKETAPKSWLRYAIWQSPYSVWLVPVTSPQRSEPAPALAPTSYASSASLRDFDGAVGAHCIIFYG